MDFKEFLKEAQFPKQGKILKGPGSHNTPLDPKKPEQPQNTPPKPNWRDKFKALANARKIDGKMARVGRNVTGKPLAPYVGMKPGLKLGAASLGANIAKNVFNVVAHGGKEVEDRVLPASLRIGLKRAQMPDYIPSDRKRKRQNTQDDDEQLAAHTVYDKIGSLLGEDELTDKALVKKRVVKKRVNKAITAEEREEK
jgi:hypothetical protein